MRTQRSIRTHRLQVIPAILALAVTLMCGRTYAAPSTAASTSEAAGNVGPKTRFVLKCYDRAFNGDPKVYDDCFTPDYKMKGPETKMVSKEPDGSLKGRAAIQAYHDMNHGDSNAWGSVKFETVWSVESGDKVIRMMRWVSEQPHGSYAGFDNLPKDLKVTINGIFVDTLRDGKIADQFFTYDTMGFITDIAQGDLKKVSAALLKMDAQMAAARRALQESKPLPGSTPAQ